ncbi:MAG: NAD-dependent epimerase/dehydratase family protein [Candidatus Dormibacteraceae bacterium]
MKVLVIGGTGFIGAATCKELMRRGFETVAASRTPQPFGTFTSHVAFDRRDEDGLARVLGEVRPDVLLDLACHQPGEVRAVLRHFHGGRYVLASTGAVYPDLRGRPAREGDFHPPAGEVPEGPLGYAEGKRWCEVLLARSRDMEWAVVRPPAVLGAGDPTGRIAAYFQRVDDGEPLLVPADSFERPAGLAWVRDVGYCLALAADLRRPAGGAYNVAFEGVSVKLLIEGIAALMGREPRLVPVPFASLPEGAAPYGPDPARPGGLAVGRARAELGFEPGPLEEALAETMAWYRVRRPRHPGYANRAAELEIAARGPHQP